MKKLFSIAICTIFSVVLFTGCTSKTSGSLTTVKLNEVTRSIFYAPLYVAINEGFFDEEGLSIELSTGQGADKTMQELLSKNADIGFSGPEQVLYIHSQKREDLPVVFAQLTQKDGSFLVARNADDNFKWESLKGKTVIGGRPAGVPQMALEYVLKNHGIDPKKDMNMITNIAFAAVPGAYKGGTGQYAAIFEPAASTFEQEKLGTIVASVGEEAGVIPYTTFYTTQSFMKDNPELVQKFTRAIYKAQLWVQKNKSTTIATSIKTFFPGTDEALIAKVVDNYKEIEAYSVTPTLKEEDMNRLMDIIQSYDSKLLPDRPEFKAIVNNSYSEKAVKTIK